MLGNWHVRFGGGPLEKYRVKLTRQLASGLPYFVAALTDGAGEWRGSRNQRLIPQPARSLAARDRPAE